MNKKAIGLIASSVYLTVTGVSTLFVSSNINQVTPWVLGVVSILGITSGIQFVKALKAALREIYRVEPHFEILTVKGAVLIGEDISLVGDGSSILVKNKEAHQYLKVSDIKYISDVNEFGYNRMTWGQFIILKNKEGK